MKTYNINIIYKRVDEFEVNANNLEEAMEKALKTFLSIPDDKYLDDSFEFDSIIEEYDEEYNIEKIKQKL